MSRGIFAAAAAALALAAGTAYAEVAEWDQKRVSAYAEELTVATRELKRALDDVAIQNFAQQNAMFKVKETVKNLDTAADSFAGAVKDGKGRDDTLARFKRVETLRRDAEVEGRSADIPESVFEKVFDVGSALMKLRPYFFDAKDPEGQGAE